MSNLFLKIILPLQLALAFTQISFGEELDFKFDPKTSKAVPTYIGKIILLRGKGKLIAQKKEYPLRIQQKIKITNQIITEQKTIVKVQMIDDTIITIGPNSIMHFNKFEFKSKTDRKTIFTLIKGQIRAHVQIKAKNGKSLIYKTPSTSMGIRGTKFLVNVHKTKSLKSVTQVALLSGKINLINDKTKKSYNLTPGMHYISLKENSTGQVAENLDHLNKNNYKRLLSQGKGEGKFINPFLALYKEPVLNSSSTNKDSSPFKQQIKNDKKEYLYFPNKSKRNWKDNLKKLNRKLKKNY